MLVAHFYLLALSSAQRVLVQAVSISINVVLKGFFFSFFLFLNIRTSDRSVIIMIITAVTNTQGIWLTLPKCIPLQS